MSRPGRVEGRRRVAILRKSGPGKEKTLCKGLEARPRKNDKASVAGSEGDWRR